MVLLSRYPAPEKGRFQVRRGICRPVLPITFTFRPRKGLWKLLGKSPLTDLHIGDPIFHDKILSRAEATRKLQQDAYHIMQGMNGIYPGTPTYNTDQDPDTYQKTM